MTTKPWLSSYPFNIKWDAPLAVTPMPDLFDRAAASYAGRVCLDFLGAKMSYRNVADAVARAAAGLQRRGVKKGTRVGLLLPNCPYFVIFYFAILKLGAVVVNMNPLYAPRELDHLIKDSGMEYAVTLDLKLVFEKISPLVGQGVLKQLVVCPFASALPGMTSALFRLFKAREVSVLPKKEAFVRYETLMANDGAFEKPVINPAEDIAVLQYTGGTTGIPKAAMLTHANIVANTLQARLWFAAAREGEETLLGVLPFFHVFAMTVAMNLGIHLGASIVMLPRFDLKQVVKTIHRKRPTLFPAVPTIFSAISNFKAVREYDLSSIRYCISGGAPLPVDVKRAFESVTGCVVVEGYGLSESSPVATCNPLQGVNKAGSIGLPLPQTTIEIISLEDGITPMPLGERGEVCILGPQVMKGYWNSKDETDHVLKSTPQGMRLHTGDVGVMDADGYVAIVDRIKDMIMCGGFKVYPRNVEEAIYLHEAVAECVVAGVPDPYRGQTVKAYIALKPDKAMTRDELMAFLHDKLSPIEMPKQVEFRESLPKTMVGKLSRKALLDEEKAKAEKN